MSINVTEDWANQVELTTILVGSAVLLGGACWFVWAVLQRDPDQIIVATCCAIVIGMLLMPMMWSTKWSQTDYRRQRILTGYYMLGAVAAIMTVMAVMMGVATGAVWALYKMSILIATDPSCGPDDGCRESALFILFMAPVSGIVLFLSMCASFAASVRRWQERQGWR